MNKHTREKLIEDIGEARYSHSIRVMETSILLAEKYGADIEKARTAAILHDCAKFEDGVNLLKLASEFDIMLDRVMENNLELLHGPIGAKIAELEYKVTDIEVLDAIRFHTTGREDMTILDKIIYISDYIEPNRNFDGLEQVRKLAFTNIDSSILLAMENTIRFLLEKNKLIHLDTIKARNYFKILLG